MGGSEFGELTLLADPRDGIAERIPGIEAELRRRDLAFTTLVGHDVEGAVRESLRGGAGFLVAAGDDITIHAVVNGCFEDGRPVAAEPPVVGVIPANGSCDLTKSFGFTDDVARACDRLLGPDVFEMDLMKATVDEDGRRTTRFAAGVAQIGFGAAAAISASRLPSGLGRGRRFAGYWAAVARSRPRRIDVQADTKAYGGPAFDVVIGNAQYGMGGLRLSPRSFPGDGVLDVVIWRGPRSDAIRLLPSLLRLGDHLPHPHITEMRAKIRVAIDADRPLPVAADNVPLGLTPATVQIVPRAIRFKL